MIVIRLCKYDKKGTKHKRARAGEKIVDRIK